VFLHYWGGSPICRSRGGGMMSVAVPLDRLDETGLASGVTALGLAMPLVGFEGASVVAAGVAPVHRAAGPARAGDARRVHRLSRLPVRHPGDRGADHHPHRSGDRIVLIKLAHTLSSTWAHFFTLTPRGSSRRGAAVGKAG